MQCGLFVGLLAIGAGAVPVLWLPLRNLFLMQKCLAQTKYKGRCLVLRHPDISCFADVHGRPVSGKYRGGMKWERRREKGCAQDVK